MQIIIKCGSDECRKEFRADIKVPEWICPHCERVIPNKNYPFLTAKLMEARSNPDNVDWKKMHEDLLADAIEKIKDKEEEINKLKKKIENLESTD